MFFQTGVNRKNIRVELGKVTFADSAFIGLLLLMYADRKSMESVCLSVIQLKNCEKSSVVVCGVSTR